MGGRGHLSALQLGLAGSKFGFSLGKDDPEQGSMRILCFCAQDTKSHPYFKYAISKADLPYGNRTRKMQKQDKSSDYQRVIGGGIGKMMDG